MRILEISIEKLFGTFDHNIPLEHADRVTLIHGPNGLGKTMMLKMIASLVEGRITIFERVPFEKFSVRLSDGNTIVIRHREHTPTNDEKRHSKLEISIANPNGDNVPISDDEVLFEVPRRVLDAIDQHVPGPYGRFGAGWRAGPNGRFHTLEDILEKFPQVAEHLPTKYRASFATNVFEGLKAFFVETTRLNAEKSSTRSLSSAHDIGFPDENMFFDEMEAPQQRYGLRVDQYSSDIVQRIKSVLTDYAKHSQESDRTFPERLVRFDRENALSAGEILGQMTELETKRQRLIALGFLDSESGLRDLTEDDVRRAPEALTIYVGDVQRKLAVFDDLSQRVGKLIDIVNERFRYKTLTLHREQGFRLKAKSGEPIQLEDLSSGEQHELVVLYELLFRAPRNGLVLVDEPEISLHVAWQSRFLADLMDILKLTGSYAIVATHSPVIIGTRWDLTKELKGPDDSHFERVL
jgi:ABC-type transport system involved in cytochrome c biogenesis ATPase subunit